MQRTCYLEMRYLDGVLAEEFTKRGYGFLIWSPVVIQKSRFYRTVGQPMLQFDYENKTD